MDPIGFVLGVASGVLTEVIGELITGKSRSIDRAEIERAVARELAEANAVRHQADLAEIRLQILREITLLAERDLDLFVAPNSIRLRHMPSRTLLDPKELRRKQLSNHLASLDQIIANRRHELGLEPVPVPEPEPSKVSDPPVESSIVWRDAPIELPPPRWNLEIADMETRIRQRRLGEDDD